MKIGEKVLSREESTMFRKKQLWNGNWHKKGNFQDTKPHKEGYLREVHYVNLSALEVIKKLSIYSFTKDKESYSKAYFYVVSDEKEL